MSGLWSEEGEGRGEGRSVQEAASKLPGAASKRNFPYSVFERARGALASEHYLIAAATSSP